MSEMSTSGSFYRLLKNETNAEIFLVKLTEPDGIVKAAISSPGKGVDGDTLAITDENFIPRNIRKERDLPAKAPPLPIINKKWKETLKDYHTRILTNIQTYCGAPDEEFERDAGYDMLCIKIHLF